MSKTLMVSTSHLEWKNALTPYLIQNCNGKVYFAQCVLFRSTENKHKTNQIKKNKVYSFTSSLFIGVSLYWMLMISYKHPSYKQLCSFPVVAELYLDLGDASLLFIFKTSVTQTLCRPE